MHTDARDILIVSDLHLRGGFENRTERLYHFDEEFADFLRNFQALAEIANGCAALAGQGFASVSRDRKLRIWTAGQLAEVIATPHTHSIKCIAASADGRLVATASYNGANETINTTTATAGVATSGAVTTQGGKTNFPLDLAVNITPTPQNKYLANGTYSDTLVVTLSPMP